MKTRNRGMGPQDEPTIEQLVAQLDDPDGLEACDTELALAELGAEAAPALLEALPHLGRGKLHAIGVLLACDPADLRRIRNPSVVDVAVPLLEHEDAVCESAAELLGHVRAEEAAPALLQAEKAAKSSGSPPDSTLRTALRHALIAVGARATPRIPARIEPLVWKRDPPLWPLRHLEEVIHALADDQLVVVSACLWSPPRPLAKFGRHFSWSGRLRRLLRVRARDPERQSDLKYKVIWEDTWGEIVASTRKRLLFVASQLKDYGPDTFVSLEWIEERDR